MKQQIYTHQFDNGLVLLAEAMPWLESAAFSLVLPAGCARDPEDRTGLSNFTCEMVQRGCGPHDSRQFVEALERLGVDRSGAVSNAHTSFGAALLSDNLHAALSIYGDMVRRPHLPADQLEEGRLVCLQELHALQDDLAQQVLLQLRRLVYPDPWGRCAQGKKAALLEIGHQDIDQHFRNVYVPSQAMVSVAGNFDWSSLRDHVDVVFGDWSDVALPTLQETDHPSRYHHISHDSNQTHIGIAFDGVPYRHPDYFQSRGAVGVLSDGMSSRLFTEVREKRGLCYTVFASCHSLRDRGVVLCYCGTSAERAQESLDVIIGELEALAKGVRQDELDRLKARIKSSLIMQQESSAARSAAVAADWYHLGRVRGLEEISRMIDQLSCDSINEFLVKNPPGHFTIVTLGPEELEVPVAVS